MAAKSKRKEDRNAVGVNERDGQTTGQAARRAAQSEVNGLSFMRIVFHRYGDAINTTVSSSFLLEKNTDGCQYCLKC